MALLKVSCPNCGSEKVVRRGKNRDGMQRYLCRNENCETKSFMTEYKYNAKKSGCRKNIINMSLDGSGVRDIARVSEISPNTVISELKKKRAVSQRLTPPILNHCKILEIQK